MFERVIMCERDGDVCEVEQQAGAHAAMRRIEVDRV